MRKIRSLASALILGLAAFGALAEPVDVNTATAEQIAAAMIGVGKAKAEAITQDRDKNGKFKSIEDLARVKGIKMATISKNRDKIIVK